MQKQIFSDKKVFIALLARNCKSALEKNIPLWNELLSFFSSDSIIQVIENDSIDGTKDILADWSKNNSSVHIYSKDTNEVTIPPTVAGSVYPGGSIYRQLKMAGFRNMYIQLMRTKKYDYLIVFDSDLDWFDVQGVITALCDAPDDWGALFANGRYYSVLWGKPILHRYYDLFAYLPMEEEYIKCGMSFDENLTYREMAVFSDILNSRKYKKIDYIPCVSAFGGIGIYNLKYYNNQEYTSKKNIRSNYFEGICEHIAFNLTFAKNKQNYICTKMIAHYKKVCLLQGLSSSLLNTKMKFFIKEKILCKVIPN